MNSAEVRATSVEHLRARNLSNYPKAQNTPSDSVSDRPSAMSFLIPGAFGVCFSVHRCASASVVCVL